MEDLAAFIVGFHFMGETAESLKGIAAEDAVSDFDTPQRDNGYITFGIDLRHESLPILLKIASFADRSSSYERAQEIQRNHVPLNAVECTHREYGGLRTVSPIVRLAANHTSDAGWQGASTLPIAHCASVG